MVCPEKMHDGTVHSRRHFVLALAIAPRYLKPALGMSPGTRNGPVIAAA
jgi:hypothetical protein